MPRLTLARVSDEILRLSRGLLGTERTLELFFSIIEGLDSDRKRKDRLTFWQDYQQRGMILDAWLALTPRCAELAFEANQLKTHQYGILQRNKRIDERHAVLLLRVGSLTVAEWSHAGKCRFWRCGSKNAPTLYAQTYSHEDLSAIADHAQQHYFSAEGRWQRDATRWIESAIAVFV